MPEARAVEVDLAFGVVLGARRVGEQPVEGAEAEAALTNMPSLNGQAKVSSMRASAHQRR